MFKEEPVCQLLFAALEHHTSMPRAEVEAETERLFFAPWSCLNESELEELGSLAGQFRDGLKAYLRKYRRNRFLEVKSLPDVIERSGTELRQAFQHGDLELKGQFMLGSNYTFLASSGPRG